jgi:hypothetical protein
VIRPQVLLALLPVAVIPSLYAAASTDIPGEGNLRCYPRSACLDSRGIVTSSPPGSATGSLLGLSPNIEAILTSSSPLFVTFSGGNTPLGPLGLNPRYQPESIRDSRIPASGQLITLDLTNGTDTQLSSVALYLLIPQTPVTEPFPVQGDGISFGVWCDAALMEPRNCAEHTNFLETPTGPGILNPLDITPSAGPDSTFGDLLRFRNVGLAPGDSARFTFFITDRKGTLDPSTGGSLGGASPTFNVEIVAEPVPEPSMFALTAAALLILYRRRRKVNRS